MRTSILVLAVAVASLPGLVPMAACKPCKLIDDPECDHTKLNNPCPPICAPDDLKSSEVGVDEQSAEPGIRDAGADG